MPKLTQTTQDARYRLAIMELVRSDNRDFAASAAGVSRATLERWTSDPRFQEIHRQARLEVWNTLTCETTQALHQATSALTRNLTCGQPSSEIRAAVALFEIALRLNEARNIEQRLMDLETKAQSISR